MWFCLQFTCVAFHFWLVRSRSFDLTTQPKGLTHWTQCDLTFKLFEFCFWQLHHVRVLFKLVQASLRVHSSVWEGSHLQNAAVNRATGFLTRLPLSTQSPSMTSIQCVRAASPRASINTRSPVWRSAASPLSSRAARRTWTWWPATARRQISGWTA